jgi:hypothetical protein
MEWFKSSYCADGSCVEVAKIDEDVVGLRDSKRPDQNFLTFGRAEWASFIAEIKAERLIGR